MLAGTSHGLYVDDRRILGTLRLEVGGESPAFVADAPRAPPPSTPRGPRAGRPGAGPDGRGAAARGGSIGARGRALTEQVTITSRASETVETHPCASSSVATDSTSPP